MGKKSISARVPGYVRRGMERYAHERDITLSKATKEAVIRQLIQTGYISDRPEGFTISATRQTLKTARKIYFQIWLAVGLFQLINTLSPIVDALFAGYVLFAITVLWFAPHLLLQTNIPEAIDPHLPFLQPASHNDGD